MSVDIAAIIKLLERIVELEATLSASIAAEKDSRRRERLLKACQERDIDAIREILFSVK